MEVIMGRKIRFNCMMKISTRDKLRDIALANNRSDSNMVEYLIDSYPKEQNESKKDNASGIRSEQAVEK